MRDEHEHILRFAKDEGLQVDPNGHIEEISDDLWREYVRQTHAARSGERVRQFFLPIDGGVADAASRICEGHWLDFEDLQDYNLYPRALRPVTCPEYQEGRIIRVDGSTDDHEVYAALEDMRIWCENQLRGCNDILARMSDPRHKLDLYHIDWRVAARGFQPVSVQFEFDRGSMFDILGDEVYQSDPYVFLRELLQNSIDAIRMRREVLRNSGIEPGDLGVIQVDVEHGENCDAVVNWTDDGIGMDEYIVRNYLAVAGKSYYRSKDFEREGLKMDPISRFGIGILSCFMVADRIEIDTLREPYMHSQSQRLKIAIPAMHRQFRIEVHPRMGAKVGTTFRVYVEGKKIPVEDEQKPPEPLKVTDYLCHNPS